ncbi:MAG: hypothetical protein JWM11_3163, partial [Planctomycetaceae bacterium]|nr:hypothetical protein [Planctomycetaceae bacterium]
MAVLSRLGHRFLCSGRVFRSCALVFVSMLFLAGIAAAQGKPATSKTAPAKPDAVQKDPLLNSAVPAPHLSRDSISSRRFEALRKAIGENKLGDVESLAKLLLELPGDRWFGEGQLLRGLRHELVRQLDLLPAHLR